MDALILVDLQYDFMPHGALAVNHGDEVIAVAQHMSLRIPYLFATQDWHPAGHQSFASSHPDKQPFDQIDLHGLPQVLWPDHCVQGTCGAELVEEVRRLPLTGVVTKGTDPEVDSYSGFFDNGRRHETELRTRLIEQGVTRVWIMGLATDYCVKATAIDAVSCGFETHLLVPGCRAVELNPGDGRAAIDHMAQAGVTIHTELPT